jgi:hypothetical protein
LPFNYFIVTFLIFNYLFFNFIFRSESSLVEINQTKKKCSQISKRLNDLMSRLLPDTDIQYLTVENIGVGVRSLLSLFCFNTAENFGVEVITGLKIAHDDTNNNNDNNDNDDKNCEGGSATYDTLDFETENYCKIVLLSLQNLCDFGTDLPSICKLLEECNFVDVISYLRSRLIESRLHSVEVGVIGKIYWNIDDQLGGRRG